MKLVCYCSGQGPLQFVWCDHEGKASGETVEVQHVVDYLNSLEGAHLKSEGFQMHKLNGRMCVARPVRRLNENTLLMGGVEYQYTFNQYRNPEWPIRTCDIDVTYALDPEMAEIMNQPRQETKNGNTLLALSSFLAHEKNWESSIIPMPEVQIDTGAM